MAQPNADNFQTLMMEIIITYKKRENNDFILQIKVFKESDGPVEKKLEEKKMYLQWYWYFLPIFKY